MPHYAISEGLLIATCLWAGYRALNHSNHVAAPAALVAVISIGAAAVIGALRYGLNLHDSLTELHNTLSGISGTAGIMCVAMALAAPVTSFAIRDHLVHFALSIVLFGVTASAYVYLPGNRLDTLIGPMIIIAAALGAWIRHRTGDRVGTVLIMASVLLLLVNGLAIGAGDELLLDLIARWHVFHTLMAVWVVVFTLAVLRPLPRRTRPGQ